VSNFHTQLTEHRLRQIVRILTDKIDAYGLRTNQSHNLLDFVHQATRHAIEQQVRFVKEKHQLRFFQISGFRQFLKQLGQQPQQKGRIELR
jgi:hypothetical protein